MPDSFDLPCTRYGFAIGCENPHGLQLALRWENGRVVCRFTLSPEKSGFAEIAHGGILATVLDEVMGWAPSVEKRRMCMAAELTFRYVKPVPIGTPMVAVARLTRDRRRLLFAEGTIEDEHGTVYVKGKGTFAPLTAAESAEIESTSLIYPGGEAKLFS